MPPAAKGPGLTALPKMPAKDKDRPPTARMGGDSDRGTNSAAPAKSDRSTPAASAAAAAAAPAKPAANGKVAAPAPAGKTTSPFLKDQASTSAAAAAPTGKPPTPRGKDGKQPTPRGKDKDAKPATPRSKKVADEKPGGGSKLAAAAAKLIAPKEGPKGSTSALPPSAIAAAVAATSAPKEGGEKKKDEKGSSGPSQKKVEFFTDDLLNRKPLDEKTREALVHKCGAGPPKQEARFLRNENKRPVGRPDELAPSRHERVPPGRVVLMFNCFEASFELLHGDLSTLPEAETTELRSLTSGKVLGRIKITPEKGTPIEDRFEFNNDWKVGSEHGIVHDGLQSDGYLELRLDWKAVSRVKNEDSVAKVALIRYASPRRLMTCSLHASAHHGTLLSLIRVNPWLAYGCGEGARLAVRKPGATEGVASTLQRALRDDYVVVRRDGTYLIAC